MLSAAQQGVCFYHFVVHGFSKCFTYFSYSIKRIHLYILTLQPMDTLRQKKMASLLQQTMSTILRNEGHHFYNSSTLVSITNVKITPDLSIARFYLSVYNSNEPQTILELMNHNNGEFRRALGAELRHNLRKIPEVEFFLDDSFEYMDKMNKLLKDIKEDKPNNETE